MATLGSLLSIFLASKSVNYFWGSVKDAENSPWAIPIRSEISGFSAIGTTRATGLPLREITISLSSPEAI
jgi:hypothetical protein